jgi:hypothetical protein
MLGWKCWHGCFFSHRCLVVKKCFISPVLAPTSGMESSVAKLEHCSIEKRCQFLFLLNRGEISHLHVLCMKILQARGLNPGCPSAQLVLLTKRALARDMGIKFFRHRSRSATAGASSNSTTTTFVAVELSCMVVSSIMPSSHVHVHRTHTYIIRTYIYMDILYYVHVM